MPTTISNRMAPSDHQSAALPWPVRVRISGARYSGVPQNECAEMLSMMPSLLSPKSVNSTLPDSSNSTCRRGERRTERQER